MKKFTFTLEENIYNMLEAYAKANNLKIKDAVNGIILFMIPVLNEMIGKENGNLFKYQKLSNPKKVRVEINEKLKRELDLFHLKLDSYSIATILRKMVELYFLFYFIEIL